MFNGLKEDPKDQFTAVFSEGHEEVVFGEGYSFPLHVRAPLGAFLWDCSCSLYS